MNIKRFYHVSAHRFRPGELIVPSAKHELVFLTNSPVVHYTILPKISADLWDYDNIVRPRRFNTEWHSYEVVPTGKIFHGACWDECFTADAVEVVRYIGNASGILRNAKPNWRDKDGAGIRGSAIRHYVKHR